MERATLFKNHYASVVTHKYTGDNEPYDSAELSIFLDKNRELSIDIHLEDLDALIDVLTEAAADLRGNE